MPSFNQGRFIRDTIESTLSQSYRPLELLVIDGASADETVDVLKSYDDAPELRWWSEPDRGVVEAVNKGFARARGHIGAIQSSDDFYVPDAIQRGVTELTSDPSLAFVFGDIIKVDADGDELMRTELAPYSIENVLALRTWIPQPSTFFRMDLAQSLGGWRDDIPYSPDTDLWLRMAFRANARKFDAVVSKRRVHEAQRDTQGAKIIRDYSRMIDESPDIRNAPDRLRRAAQAGKHLIHVRYNPRNSELYAAWHLLLAGLAFRPCLDVGAIAKHLVYLPIRKLLSRLKRLLLTRPQPVA